MRQEAHLNCLYREKTRCLLTYCEISRETVISTSKVPLDTSSEKIPACLYMLKYTSTPSDCTGKSSLVPNYGVDNAMKLRFKEFFGREYDYLTFFTIFLN